MKVLKLSNNISIPLLNNEIEIVLKAITSKDNIVALKNGIFNSSYFVAIVDNNNKIEYKKKSFFCNLILRLCN